jgi:hypothetical protein
VGTSVDRRPGKGGETAFQNDRTSLSCLTDSLSVDFLKKGGKSRSEYEKASLERIQAEIIIYFMPKAPLFQPISFECNLQIKSAPVF